MSQAAPPPGQLIDISGYKLHVQLRGAGSPAVVMDSGLGGNSLAWGNALPAVAKVTQAVAFDRAGYAWSEPALEGTPRHSGQLVAELSLLSHKLLRQLFPHGKRQFPPAGGPPGRGRQRSAPGDRTGKS